MNDTPHIPVLLHEVVNRLQPQPGETYFDGTAGYGGHAAKVLEEMGLSGRAILVDRDPESVAALRLRFKQDPRVSVQHGDYLTVAEGLQQDGCQLDMVLLDLGVSSPQLDQPERGFSFRTSGPLDMRMNQSEGVSAADIVNRWPEKDLADVVYRYGEERKSRRVAKAIVTHRPFTTTKQLADVVAAVVGWHEDIHPATRTFQALRVAVNDELQQLGRSLPILTGLLRPGGRVAVISFHSLEDRIVKEYFRQEARDCICPPAQPVCTCNHRASLELLTKKPVTGTNNAFNPRARSAKLRVAVKLKPKQRRDT